MFNLKSLFTYFLLFVISMVGFIVIANYSIIHHAKGKTYDKINQIPENRVGLVLGTAKKLQNGTINLYFKYRVEAAVELYQNHKIAYILVSGDNSTHLYDEPNDFKDELIQKGIPADKIFLDHAGFRTLDSMIRAKEVFGLNQFTIISQKFHNQRAIYLADQNGIDAIGYNAKDIQGRYGYKTKLREYLARAKVFLDIIFQVQPKYKGKPIKIQ